MSLTIPAGSRVRAEDLLAVTDQVTSLTDPGWTDYSGSFALTATTTSPTKGNSTYLARYRRPAGADLVHYEGYILIGSTYSAGSGLYRFSVPVAASANAILCAVGSVSVIDTGTAGRTAIAEFVTSTTLQFVRNADISCFTPTIPQTWATGDIIRWSIAYEPA